MTTPISPISILDIRNELGVGITPSQTLQYSYSAPVNTTVYTMTTGGSLTATICGGGGGGAGGRGGPGTERCDYSGLAGAPGEVTTVSVSGLPAGSVVSISVASGGAGGVAGAVGSPGGTTTLTITRPSMSTLVYTANGGAGGGHYLYNGNPDSGHSGSWPPRVDGHNFHMPDYGDYASCISGQTGLAAGFSGSAGGIGGFYGQEVHIGWDNLQPSEQYRLNGGAGTLGGGGGGGSVTREVVWSNGGIIGYRGMIGQHGTGLPESNGGAGGSGGANIEIITNLALDYDPYPLDIGSYYAGGPYISNPPPTSAYQTAPIPTSGRIEFGSFKGLSAAFIFNDVVASDLNNYNFINRAIAAGWNGTSRIVATVVVNAGVVVYSLNPLIPAARFGALPANSTLSITNNGEILGAGGAGGSGGNVDGGGPDFNNSNNTFTNGQNGQDGGTAVLVEYAVTLRNNGIIAGGGGGGGGGGATHNTSIGASGGGGGGGQSYGVAGSAGSSTNNFFTGGVASNGSPGTKDTAGAGGAGFLIGSQIRSGEGRQGGGWGAAGLAGAYGDLSNFYASGGYSAPGNGGAGGAAIVGNSFITWTAFGSRFGSINN